MAALLLLLSGLALRNNIKAGIVVSVFLILTFSYGHVFGLLMGWPIRHRHLMVAWALLFVVSAYFIIKTRKSLHQFTKVLNVAAASLVAMSLFQLAAYEFNAGLDGRGKKRAEEMKTQITEHGAKDELPDIYYIILDRYAAANTLKEIYDFDNSEFIDYLSSRGFYVASKSRSNYLTTAHSLSSSLNMQFLDRLSAEAGNESNDWTLLNPLLQDHQVGRLLKANGYKYFHFGDLWTPTAYNRNAEANVNRYWLPQFSAALFKTTMFCIIGLELGIYDFRREHWQRILYKFDKLAEMPAIKEPTFVFAHMLIPHDPFVFDTNGDFLAEEEAGRRSGRENYVNQVIFANKKLQALIDKLLSSPGAHPIIIVQADEGPYPARSELDLRHFNWKQASQQEVSEKLRILNAYYLPNVDKKFLYPSITPVNSFRLIFNLYFNANFELLPDESYIFADEDHLYEFFDVTDQVEYENGRVAEKK
jgi:hypothetical protein